MIQRVLIIVALFIALPLIVAATQAPVAPNYTIGPRDVLSISIVGQPDLTGKSYTVDADGSFSFPMIGRIRAADLTVAQLEDALRTRLMPDFFRNPQIAISIDEYLSKQIIVSGEVARPGRQPYTGGLTLLGVLANAGGALPTSAGEVLIARARGPRNTMAPPAPRGAGDLAAGQDAQEEGDPFEGVRIDLSRLQAGALELDVEIRDGDTVLVPRAESAYVLGEVNSPGAYPVQRATTLEQLLSLAGGLSVDAAQGRISIERDGKTLRTVRLSDPVRPGDTIKVPPRFV